MWHSDHILLPCFTVVVSWGLKAFPSRFFHPHQNKIFGRFSESVSAELHYFLQSFLSWSHLARLKLFWLWKVRSAADGAHMNVEDTFFSLSHLMQLLSWLWKWTQTLVCCRQGAIWEQSKGSNQRRGIIMENPQEPSFSGAKLNLPSPSVFLSVSHCSAPSCFASGTTERF